MQLQQLYEIVTYCCWNKESVLYNGSEVPPPFVEIITTETLGILVGFQRGDMFAQYLFVIVLHYAMRTTKHEDDKYLDV